MHVCLPVCLSVRWHISKNKQFFCKDLWFVAQSSADCNAMRYVLPVLWIMLCFHIMERMGQNQRRMHVLYSLRQVLE